jgi:flagellar hook-length control protein FliK
LSKGEAKSATISSVGSDKASTDGKAAKASDEPAAPAQDDASAPADAAQADAAAADVAALLAAAAAGQGIQAPNQGAAAKGGDPQAPDGSGAVKGAEGVLLAASGGSGEAGEAGPGKGEGKAVGKAARGALPLTGTQVPAGQATTDEANAADAETSATTPVLETKPQGEAAPMRMHPSLQALGDALKAGGEASAALQSDGLAALSGDGASTTPSVPSAAALGHRQAGAPAASGPAAPTQQPASTTPAMPLSAVPIEIGMKALEGSQAFRIRLHPEDLGQIDVKLHIDDDGTVKAQLTADRVETLAMLQRDAKTLERAFEQAGLKTSDSGLQFSLGSDNGQAGRQQQNQQGSGQNQQQTFQPLAGQELTATIRAIQAAAGGLDIRI